MKNLFSILFLTLIFSCLDTSNENKLIYQDESNFSSIRQVTFGGDNAEAYWSFDDKNLVFQSNYNKWGLECDQIFLMGSEDTFESKAPAMLSMGYGRTTCAYFMPDNKHILYGSTHLQDNKCPEVPLRREGKYVWPIYDSFDIFISDLEGNIVNQLTKEIVTDSSDSTTLHSRFNVDVTTAVRNEAMYVDPFLPKL